MFFPRASAWRHLPKQFVFTISDGNPVTCPEITIWSIAWRNLVASCDYAFRVYGQLDSFMRQQEWTKLHGDVLQGLMSEEIRIEIDTRGRLIVIDHSNTSLPWMWTMTDSTKPLCSRIRMLIRCYPGETVTCLSGFALR